eukprot:159718-Lingulodinium_polyedra.AAC.1
MWATPAGPPARPTAAGKLGSGASRRLPVAAVVARAGVRGSGHAGRPWSWRRPGLRARSHLGPLPARTP